MKRPSVVIFLYTTFPVSKFWRCSEVTRPDPSIVRPGPNCHLELARVQHVFPKSNCRSTLVADFSQEPVSTGAPTRNSASVSRGSELIQKEKTEVGVKSSFRLLLGQTPWGPSST